MAGILAKLGDTIDESITESNIESCHRVPTRHPDKSNIVVQFRSSAKRDVALQKAKKMRLTNEDLGLDDSTVIYVNEHLTPQNKRLLGAAVAGKKEVAWKFVWTKNGAILARRNENSRTVRIHSEADLLKMMPVTQFPSPQEAT